MQEMLPITSGLILGVLLAVSRLPVYLRVVLILILAAIATIVSGEFRLSWDFLFPDIAEIMVACAAGFFGVKMGQHYLTKMRSS